MNPSSIPTPSTAGGSATLAPADGRPGQFLGIEIGGTKLQIVSGGADRVRRRWRATVEPSRGGPGICRQIEAGLKELSSEGGAAAVGVGFGGPVDWRAGRIRRSHQIDGWEDFPIADWLSDLTGAPAVVENDANAACLGEAVHGAGAGLDPVFYATFGSGVGGGFVSGGAVYHGAPPGEAEFGHLLLDRDGTTVESRCSGWSVDARIRRLKAEDPGSALARALGDTPGGEAKHLAAALSQRDRAARRVLDEVAGDIAFALSHVVHLLHPRVVLLGGGLSLVGEPLRAAVAAQLPRFVMEAFRPPPEVRLAALGEDAVPVGALELAARHAPSRERR